MKRKAIAVAVGALFVAPAVQAQITFGNEQIGTVQIYGKLYPQIAYFKADDATQPGASVSTLVSANGVLGGAAAGITAVVFPSTRRTPTSASAVSASSAAPD